MRRYLQVFLLAAAPYGAHGQSTPYVNPLDGKTYEATWSDRRDKAPKGEAGGGVSLSGVRLLSSQQAFDRNVDAKQLAEFIEATKANVAFVAGEPEGSYSILLETVLTPGGVPKFALASRGAVPKDTLEKIYKSLGSLPDLRSRLDTLKYQLEFSAGGDRGRGDAGRGKK